MNLTLDKADRTATPPPAKPALPPSLEPPKASGAEERAYLFETVIRPLLGFSTAQEEALATERQRADGVVAKVDQLNTEIAAADRPKSKPWWKVWGK